VIERHYLGWERPCLYSAGNFLIERYAGESCLDLENVTVVLPGARAGRRLLEILVERADERGLELTPPKLITVGSLPEELFETPKPPASDILQLLVWSDVLRQTRPDAIQRLLETPPGDDDFGGWLSIAESLRRVQRELAGERLEMADVPPKCESLEIFADAERWTLLAELEHRYFLQLETLGYCDPQHARLEALKNGSVETCRDIILVGAADMNGVLRSLLDEIQPRVTVLVFAPDSFAAHFDEHGCIRSEAWRTTTIAVEPQQISLVDRPADQAAAVVDVISDYQGRYSAEEITVGAADDQVVPYLVKSMNRCRLPFHVAAGTALATSPPYRLLATVSGYLDSGSFRDFAALLRHPAVEAWLGREGRNNDAAATWLSTLDRYAKDHLEEYVSGRWLGSPAIGHQLEPLRKKVATLLGAFDGPPRRLDEWARPVLDLLLAVYDEEPLEPLEPISPRTLEIFESFHAKLQEIHALDRRAAPVVGASDALRLVLRQVAQVSVPQPSTQSAVELLGWLELPLDDAPALVVTGFNEGRVPRSVNADAFLPNSLRRHLGLVDNDRRYARDAYALSALLASRQVNLVLGRRNTESDHLTPSRLLFACERETLADRVEQLFAASSPRGLKENPSLPSELEAGRDEPDFPIPRPHELDEAPVSMSITSFRDYLACPYGFYLRHVLKLKPLDDGDEELDALAFGNIAHDVLRDFGRGALAASSDARRVATHIGELLDNLVTRQYGGRPRPAVAVQVEQLRSRLRAFADWQTRWVSEGWRIQRVEVSVGAEEDAGLVVDDETMALRGRIDRVDFNEKTGQRIVFDYKTSDNLTTPEKVHVDKRTGWVDLQLPLYRHLAAALGFDGPLGLGYIVLPKDVGKVGHHLADWSTAELKSADEKARWVVSQVRDQIFWPPVRPVPLAYRDYSAIYQEDQIVWESGDEEEEPAA